MGKELGELIRVSRENAGLSQIQIAAALRVRTPQSVSNIERGVSPLPANKIKYLAKVLKVPPIDIVDVMLKEKREKLLKVAGIR